MRFFVGGKLFVYMLLLPIGVLSVLAWLNYSYFELILALCTILFWLAQLWLVSLLDKSESAQKVRCLPVGFFLIIPAALLIGVGILCILRDSFVIPFDNAIYMIGLSVILSLCFLLQIIVVWEQRTVAGRFIKLTAAAALSVPLSLMAVLILQLTGVDRNGALRCMSTVLAGAVALLIAANLIMVSICHYKSTIESIRMIRGLIKKHKLIFTRVSILKDAFFVVGKLVLSIISLSFFMFVNALYSAGMGIARYIALKMHTQEKQRQITSYRHVGIIIFAASICYVLYSVRLFFGGKMGVYDMNIALVIACYTFIEFGINIKEALRLRKSKALEAKALRAISFSATLISFVLTQTAIMSFAAKGDSSFANALSGMVFGSLAALTGLYVIMDSFAHQKASTV